MAASGETGVFAALLAWALLSSLCGNLTGSPVYLNRTNNSSHCHGVEFQFGKTMGTGYKHFGFGRGAIFTCVWVKSQSIGLKHTRAVRKRQNNNSLIISYTNVLDLRLSSEETQSYLVSPQSHPTRRRSTTITFLWLQAWEKDYAMRLSYMGSCVNCNMNCWMLVWL